MIGSIQKEGAVKSSHPSFGSGINTLQGYGNYIPLDFIKAKIIGIDIEYLKSVLDFGEFVNTDTGELLVNQDGKGKVKQPKRYAKWYNLNFMLVYSHSEHREVIYLSGSFHTFSNRGEHNHNDFSMDRFNMVLRVLKRFLKVRPQNLFIYQLEWGVNVKLEFPVEVVLKHCILFRWKRFKGNDYYIQGGSDVNYLIKIYDKGFQFGLNDPLLRIERKQMDWRSFSSKLGIGRTLQDLIDVGFEGLEESLIKTWEEVLFFDPFIVEVDLLKYRDVFYWEELSQSRSRTARNNKVQLLRRLNKEIGEDTQTEISFLIKDKINTIRKERLTFSKLVYTPKLSTPTKRIINTHYGLTA